MMPRALVLAVVLGLAAPAAAAPVLTRRTLPNGIRVLVREDPGAGVVAVSLQVRAGSRFETPETAGITNFLHRVMVRGAGRRDAAQLAEAAEAVGGTLDAGGDVESSEVRGTALARHWETLLGLVAGVALAPALTPGEIERERRLTLSQIQTRADTPFPLSFDTLLADLYGPHPYALPSLGRRPSVERLTRDALLAHHQAVYWPDRMVVAVSGRVERERVLRAVERLFGGLPARSEAPPEAAPAPVPRAERRLVEKAAHQAQILIGFLAPGLLEPDHPAVKVLGAVLGGGMGSRLFSTLRDTQGLAYSSGVLTSSRTGPAYFIAYIGTARENVATAEAGMRRELER
ncbi:MAG: insulinase family protein, partial [Candidatus Rokubacteria bacterium]|nr:insulinase family protein [Candidatus Rokubacteria bacterium]